MGCGESKHAIATENTISQSKRSNSKKNIEETARKDDVLISNTTQEGSGNVVVKPGTGNSIAKGSDNADEKVLAGGNVKEAEKVDQVLEKQGDQCPKAEDVKESDDQIKGESVVENAKENGNKEAPPVAEDAVDEEKEEEEKKEVKEENSLGAIEKGEAKEQEDAKWPQIDKAKTDASEEKTDSNEVVEEKESTKEIETETETQTKKDEVLEDQNEVNKGTGEEETGKSAEAKDSANNGGEKIQSAKEEIEIESAEKDKKGD